jgi:hypothetical protein
MSDGQHCLVISYKSGSAVAEVYILAKYMPKMRHAFENKWEPFLQTLTRAA